MPLLQIETMARTLLNVKEQEQETSTYSFVLIIILMPSIMAIVGRIPATTDIMSTDHYTSTTEQKTDKLITKIRLKLNKMNRK